MLDESHQLRWDALESLRRIHDCGVLRGNVETRNLFVQSRPEWVFHRSCSVYAVAAKVLSMDGFQSCIRVLPCATPENVQQSLYAAPVWCCAGRTVTAVVTVAAEASSCCGRISAMHAWCLDWTATRQLPRYSALQAASHLRAAPPCAASRMPSTWPCHRWFGLPCCQLDCCANQEVLAEVSIAPQRSSCCKRLSTPTSSSACMHHVHVL